MSPGFKNVCYISTSFFLREDVAVKVEELGRGCLACRALSNSISFSVTRNTQGRCCSFCFRDQKTAWFAIWESGALQSLQKSLAFFSHCFRCVNALIMRGVPQCCTCSYSVDQREVLLSSFTFSVSWWLRLANKLWSLRNSDDNAGSSAGYRMQFLFLLNLQHKHNMLTYSHRLWKNWDVLSDQKYEDIWTPSFC